MLSKFFDLRLDRIAAMFVVIAFHAQSPIVRANRSTRAARSV
jgi:hypothetical protein